MKTDYIMNHRESYIYTQCTDSNGNKGCFLGDGDKNSISPVFDDLVQLFTWVNHSRFECMPGSYIKCRIREGRENG